MAESKNAIGEEKYCFFWGKTSPFSNFYPSPMTMSHPAWPRDRTLVKYRFMEQRIMHVKAVIFKDDAIAKQIMEATTPSQCQKLGRKVENYDNEKWAGERGRIAEEGLTTKFRQNPRLMRELLRAEGKFVEASPKDTIWGIGLAESDPLAKKRATWRGTNLLGTSLDNVKANFVKEGWGVSDDGTLILPKKE